MKKQKTSQLKYYFVCTLVLLFQPLANAQQVIKGEIINVNYEYQIAFTDIGSAYLNPGDIVEVQMMSGGVVPLKVVESTDVLSQLKIDESLKKDDPSKLFGKINVGDTVVKVNKEPSSVTEKVLPAVAETNVPAMTIETSKIISSVPKSPDVEKVVPAQYDQLNFKYQEVNDKMWELNQHISYLNKELTAKNVRIEALQKENKSVKKSLSDSYINIEELKREKQVQAEKITKLEKIIKQLKSKFVRISKLLKKIR